LSQCLSGAWACCHKYWCSVHLVVWWRRSCIRPSPTSHSSSNITYVVQKVELEMVWEQSYLNP